MKTITLDDIEKMVKEKEESTHEDRLFTAALMDTVKGLMDIKHSTPVKIITDYDTDGVTSGYIMYRTLKMLHPDMHVEVVCNDRRNGYGISHILNEYRNDEKWMSREHATQFIVLDMGSNELKEIGEVFGKDTFVIDHHLFTCEHEIYENPDRFKDELHPYESPYSEKSYNAGIPMLLNPKASPENQADYCTAGIVLRLYQMCKEHDMQYDKWTDEDIRESNTMEVVGCIGTCTDMVDLLDTNGYNRNIVKRGMSHINNADETNLDFIIGRLLAMNDIGEEDVTAKRIAFNVGSFINAASRMGEITGMNGAQFVLDTLLGDEKDPQTYINLQELAQMQAERKSMTNERKTSDEFIAAIKTYRENDEKFVFYVAPEGTPNSFCGLLASTLCENTGKPSIVFTKNGEGYSGSGRNVPGSDSLKEYIDGVLEGSDLNIRFGGHHDAIGVSFVESIDKLKESMLKNQSSFKTGTIDTFLDVDLSDTNKVVERLMNLEPIGSGLKIPPVALKGKESERNRLFMKKSKNWKTVKLKSAIRGNITYKEDFKISDFGYDPDSYPQDKNGNINVLANIETNIWQGNTSLSFSAVWNRDFIERAKSEIEHPEKDNTERS